MATAVLLLLGCAGLASTIGAVIAAVALPRAPEAAETDHGFYLLDKPAASPTASDVAERYAGATSTTARRPSDFEGMSLHPL